MKKLLCLLALVGLAVAPLAAQQTGSISGKVTLGDGEPIPGVLIQAQSANMPQAVTTSSGADGTYRFPFLTPGDFEVSFSLDGMATETRSVKVRLDANTVVNVALAPEAIEEAIEVVGQSSIIDPSSTEIKTSIDSDEIDALPVGQDYRDLQKLIPGVQYSEYTVRGPSAGGSGQDNVYLFDGVNVSLPLFGTLASDSSAHDIDQVSVVKGGAKAIDFNRSAGFLINSVSKSGTNQFHGAVSYQAQTAGLTGDQDTSTTQVFDEDRDWTTASIGGPIVPQRLFFYASYYSPTRKRSNSANAYGSVPDFETDRDEYFARLTFQPTNSLLIHGSYRDSDTENKNESIGSFGAPSTAVGSASTLEITTLEASWVLTANDYLTLKYTDFANETFGGPNNLLGFQPSVLTGLDVNDLASQGLLVVPSLIAGEDAYNQFITPILNQYGFLENGVPTGGGTVGADDFINDQDFFRENFQIGYDRLFGSNVTHELHVGYQTYTDEEDLDRTTNGWGIIEVPGGRTTADDGTPIFFTAELLSRALAESNIPLVHSEFESENIEVNDTIRWKNWAFNVGVLASKDTLFGQGLVKNSSNLSGFAPCPTLDCPYEMYEIDFSDQIQPRLGAVWSYDGTNTAYASFARYNPAASSLPRAASFARNFTPELFVDFAADGSVIQVEEDGSSTGKFFVPDMDPRTTDEYMIGTSRQLTSNLNARVTGRYRRSYNYWEDTNNTARVAFDPPAGIPREPYIPDLDIYRQEVSSDVAGGSSYVIAELDGAFTKYYELATELEWRGDNGAFARGSYVWSHYYGNFDQDNTTTTFDGNIFIGSSNLADGAGRQVWNMKYGNLNGDRRHQLKVYGSYPLAWDASVGAFAIYQSGQPWEAWNVEVYRQYTSSSSDTIRFAEAAGSRKTPAHYQIDLNYTQNFRFGGDRYNVQLRADLFNLFDKQTGYAPNPDQREDTFGAYRAYYAPRRIQLMAKFDF